MWIILTNINKIKNKEKKKCITTLMCITPNSKRSYYITDIECYRTDKTEKFFKI